MTRYRKKNNFQDTIKDYIVPIIGGALLLLVIFSILNKDSGSSASSENTPIENRSPVNITFEGENTAAVISYPNGSKETINESQSLYKGETIIVKEGSLSLEFTNNTDIALNKIAELKYNENGSFSLYSSDAWMTLGEDTNISMKYATIQASKGTTLSLTQNEAASTIYILSGSAKVSNLEGVSTSLIKGQKLSVARQYAANADIDLSSEKGNIDSYFKGSDWFIENQGYDILSQDNSSADAEATITPEGLSDEYLSFDSLRDEMSTSEARLNISGTILHDSIASISINNQQATINSQNKTFSINNVGLGKSINDLVIKIYAADKSILEKKVITVYSSAGVASTSNTNTTTAVQTTPVASSGGATFEVDATDFGFTSPTTSGKFVATGSEITIRGITTAENISKVEVNGFKLASFNGSTWRYHAFERFETLEEGTNQYKVDYFGPDGSIVYTDYYTIVKRPATTQTPATDTVELISNEATVE